jgi:hypothetical protein
MSEIFPGMPMGVKFVVAFIVVLALIGLAAWLVRRFNASRLTGSARGRQPRLAVIDAASVDGRRRLVLIRRDNVEHLMMIGGPNDVIVEPNIVRATAARDTGRDLSRDAFRQAPQEARQESRQEARPVPLGESNGNWPLQPSVEPPPAPRSYRPPVTDEPWVAPEPPSVPPSAPPPAPPRETNLQSGLRARPADSITGMAAAFNARFSPEPDLPPSPSPRQAAPPVPPSEPAAAAPPSPPLPPQTDRNLAEMAQRLEAALRRPGGHDETHPPVTDPLAAAIAKEPSTQPSKPVEPRVEPRLDVAPEPKPELKAEPDFEPDFKPEPKPEPHPDTRSAAAKSAKNPFDSLEEEMASLLGRQSGKT